MRDLTKKSIIYSTFVYLLINPTRKVINSKLGVTPEHFALLRNHLYQINFVWRDVTLDFTKADWAKSVRLDFASIQNLKLTI